MHLCIYITVVFFDMVSDKRSFEKSFEKSFIVIFKMILCMILCKMILCMILFKNHMLNPFKYQCVILPDFTVDFSVEIKCKIRS